MQITAKSKFFTMQIFAGPVLARKFRIGSVVIVSSDGAHPTESDMADIADRASLLLKRIAPIQQVAGVEILPIEREDIPAGINAHTDNFIWWIAPSVDGNDA